ncbi:MAG: hypothetical protein ACSHXI_02160 [Hoeflea sp.]|uniref:hypothetical protein n=1 Tax=Hoeflea sp. TaxID=1940281 RepID=UPI003EF635E8
MPSTYLSPEEISSHDELSREEKLELLNDLMFDVKLQSSRGTIDPDQAELLMASIEQSVARVTRGSYGRRGRSYSKHRAASAHTPSI